MSKPFDLFVTTPTLAKYAGVDPRTAGRRLSSLGFDCDAAVCDAAGDVTPLWKRERLAELLAAIERAGRVIIPLAELLVVNAPPRQ